MTNTSTLRDLANSREQRKQDSISFGFSRLINDPFRTQLAIKDGTDIKVTFNGANPSSLLSKVKRMFFPVAVPNLTPEDILDNLKFKDYQKMMKREGFDVDVNTVTSFSADEALTSKIMTGIGITAVGATAAIIATSDTNSDAQNLGGVFTLLFSTFAIPGVGSHHPAQCTLRLTPTEKGPAPKNI